MQTVADDDVDSCFSLSSISHRLTLFITLGGFHENKFMASNYIVHLGTILKYHEFLKNYLILFN